MYEWLDNHPDLWPPAQAAFELTAELISDDIAARLDVPDGGSVLDIGGGHGLYSIAVCNRFPSVSATVLDDPAVRDIAAQNVAAAGLDDRITFEESNCETDTVKSTYDAALVFNVVHRNNRETNRELFDNLADAVVPGSLLVILNQFGDEARASIANTGTRFLDLTYLVSLGGRMYHTDSVFEWLDDAGFRRTGRHDFTDRNMTLLLAERV